MILIFEVFVEPSIFIKRFVNVLQLVHRSTKFEISNLQIKMKIFSWLFSSWKYFFRNRMRRRRKRRRNLRSPKSRRSPAATIPEVIFFHNYNLFFQKYIFYRWNGRQISKNIKLFHVIITVSNLILVESNFRWVIAIAEPKPIRAQGDEGRRERFWLIDPF